MYNHRNKRAIGFIFAALLATSAALGQSVQLQHADNHDHGTTFHNLEHFSLTFRTDGTVPDADVQSVSASFDPIPDDSRPPIRMFGFGVNCNRANPTTLLTVQDGKFICENQVVPGNVFSGKYAITRIDLNQAKLNHGHTFNIAPLVIEVINNDEHEMELFDQNQPKDVNVKKQ
jgi:hypothetical protein